MISSLATSLVGAMSRCTYFFFSTQYFHLKLLCNIVRCVSRNQTERSRIIFKNQLETDVVVKQVKLQWWIAALNGPADAPFLFPLKISENLWYSDIFRSCEKGTLPRNGIRFLLIVLSVNLKLQLQLTIRKLS